MFNFHIEYFRVITVLFLLVDGILFFCYLLSATLMFYTSRSEILLVTAQYLGACHCHCHNKLYTVSQKNCTFLFLLLITSSNFHEF